MLENKINKMQDKDNNELIDISTIIKLASS